MADFNKSIFVKFLLLLFFSIGFQGVCSGQNFQRVTEQPIATDGGWSLGASMVDINEDGWLDIYVSNGGDQQNFYYRNNGNGTFDKIEDSPLLTGFQPTNVSVWADYNNDGMLDGYLANSNYRNNKLFKGNSSSFVFLSEASPSRDNSSSLGAAWGDYNEDGYVDLFVVNGYYDDANILYRNNGDGTFTSLPESPVSQLNNYSYQGSWIDFDSDGDLDLVVANYGTTDNSVFVNYKGTFLRRKEGVIVGDVGSNGLSWGDYDNDGDMDLFMTGSNENENYNNLYKNNGEGHFTAVTGDTLVNAENKSVGSCWADFNNDGFLDLYVANRSRENGPAFNTLYKNKGNGSFTLVDNAISGAESEANDSISLACGDYDNDGFTDIFVANRKQDNSLFRNKGNSNNWLTVKLEGTRSNRSAVGAKIKAKAIIDGKAQWQYKTIQTSTGHRSQNSLRAKFGLGNATEVDSLVVDWPSGGRQIKTHVQSNQFVRLVEDSLITELNVNIPKKPAIPGDTVTVPVMMASPVDSGYTAFEFSIKEDSALQFTSASTQNSVIENSNWILSSNETETSINVSAAGPESISGKGTLFQLHFVVPETARGSYPINVSRALFDKSKKPQKIDHGEVFIPDFGDVDFNEKVQAFDASVILKHVVGKKSFTRIHKHYADVSQLSGVTSLDAALILKYTTGQVTSLPVEKEDGAYVADGSVKFGQSYIDNNGLLTIPLHMKDAENIYGMISEVEYDSAVLEIKNVKSTASTDITVMYENKGGKIRIAGAASKVLNGDSDLMELKFSIKPDIETNHTSVKVSKLRWNEETATKNVTSRTIKSLTSIEKEDRTIPSKVKLKQNYPNPFNPTTTIQFSLPQASNVRVTVYNSIGQKVVNLLNKSMTAGSHAVTFDATGMPSGVYIYRLKADGFSQSRKMLLVK